MTFKLFKMIRYIIDSLFVYNMNIALNDDLKLIFITQKLAVPHFYGLML